MRTEAGGFLMFAAMMPLHPLMPWCVLSPCAVWCVVDWFVAPSLTLTGRRTVWGLRIAHSAPGGMSNRVGLMSWSIRTVPVAASMIDISMMRPSRSVVSVSRMTPTPGSRSWGSNGWSSCGSYRECLGWTAVQYPRHSGFFCGGDPQLVFRFDGDLAGHVVASVGLVRG